MAVKSEIFADRAYGEDGVLASRTLAGAVLHDPQATAKRCVRMVRAGAIETMAGASIPVAIDSICLHSDTPGAVAMAHAVRGALEGDGVRLAAFSAR